MPIPKFLCAPGNYEPDVKVKDIIKDKLTRGLIKECACGRYVSSDLKICGACMSVKTYKDLTARFNKPKVV